VKILTIVKFASSLLLGLALVLTSHTPLRAGTFTWGGAPILAGDDPSFFPSGTAVFEVNGSTLTLTLTNTTTQPVTAAWQALSGLTWDISNGVTLTAVSAVVGGSSILLNPPFVATDLSGEWAFRDDISAGSSPSGPLGTYGIGAIGDINFGVDTFGSKDCFATDPSNNDKCDSVFGKVGPGGIDAAIVGPNFSPNGGFGGPVVQNEMVFTFNITNGTLTQDEITNVQALFGTDGAPAIPEPATLLLLGSGLLGMGLLGRKKLKG
jgi:hypothetical protein